MCDFTTLSRVERVQFSPSPRRADAACLENRGLTATTYTLATVWPRNGEPGEPDTARVYLMSHSQFRPSKLRMAPMIKI